MAATPHRPKVDRTLAELAAESERLRKQSAALSKKSDELSAKIDAIRVKLRVQLK